MTRKLLPLVFLLSFLGMACEDNLVSIDPLTTNQAYYPLQVGRFRVYSVTETNYRNNVGQTEAFEIRERIDEQTVDQAGRTWYRVEVSRRGTASQDWRVIGIKMTSGSVTDFRIQENNQTLVHLVFPMKDGKSWRANPLNSSEEDKTYSYRNVGQPFALEQTNYPTSVTLIQADTENLLRLDEKYEVLALGIGPVFRYSRDFNYCNGDSGVTCEVGTGYIVTGKEREEVLLEEGMIN